MKIYPACECRTGADHYYCGCSARATVRVRYRVFGLIPISRLLCEICASVYWRPNGNPKVTIENIEAV
jgi:hypothetical protein